MSTPDAVSLSTVLVHVDLRKDMSDRLSVAQSIAERHGAALSGVAAGRLSVPVYTPFGEGLLTFQPDLVDQMQRETMRRIEEAEKRFRAAAPADSAFHHAEMLEPDAFLATRARAADLVVVGRGGSGDTSDPLLGVSPSDLVMTVGRPVLVVPPGVTRLSGRRIVVAWKDSREARRALSDALPFLRACDEAFIVTVADKGQTADTADIVVYLGRYGVAAKAVHETGHASDVAACLIRVCQRVDADLLVAGAFGHSRMQEWILGGVTRDLLDHAPVCCLLSH